MSGVRDLCQVDKAKTASHNNADDLCKGLIRDLDPQCRRGYFSEDITQETKERTKRMQDVVLSLLRRGPVRDCIEERAQRKIRGDPSASSNIEYDREPEDSALEIHSPFLKEICDLFATANDDNAFFFLCLLFDKDMEDSFDVVAGSFMEIF